MNKQQAILKLVNEIIPTCKAKGAYLQYGDDYVIVGYRRFRFDNKRYCNKMQSEIDDVKAFVDGFVPLINGYIIRNPFSLDETRQLKNFLDLHGLKAEKVGFRLFIEGVLVDKTLDVSKLIKGA